MVNGAAVQRGFLLDADLGIAAGSLTSWGKRCLFWRWRGLDVALADSSFITDTTTLAEDSRFARDSHGLVAGYDGAPFAPTAFRPRISSIPQHQTTDENVLKHVVASPRCSVASDERLICLMSERGSSSLRISYDVRCVSFL